jgi:hypothetical protein
MRSITLFVLLLLTTSYCFANEIDKLQTHREVTTFLRAKLGKGWKEEVFFEPAAADTAAYGKNKFFKLDLDANGSTDLVVNGKYLFAVTDDGSGKYTSHFIDRGVFTSSKYALLTILQKNSSPLFVVKHSSVFHHPVEGTTKPDTLTFKFGDFVEYLPSPTKLQVRQINFSTSGCFGTCPIFELIIQADRTAKYHAIDYNKRKGRFTAVIDTAAYARLLATLQYIRLPTLKDSYRVNWTDDQTVELEVKLSDGQVKKIHDYGAIGTFGLATLYAQLYKLRETQNWK